MFRIQPATAASVLLSHGGSGIGASRFLFPPRQRLCWRACLQWSRMLSSSSPFRAKGPARATKIPDIMQRRTLPKPPPASFSSFSSSSSSPSPLQPPRQKPRSNSRPTTAAAPGSARSVAELLGRRSVSTLLYQAPSHFWFRATTLSVSVACVIYSLGNYWSVYVNPPAGLLWWVPHAFGAICAVMISAGVFIFMGGFRIIRAIHAVPAARIESLAGRAAATTTARAVKDAGLATAPPVFLQLEIGRMLPLLPARKRYILPSALELPHRLSKYGLSGNGIASLALGSGGSGAGSDDTELMSARKRIAARFAEQERMKKHREYEMNHLMTAPFRHAGQGAQTAWKGVRRAFSRDGFMKVSVNGEKHKLDVSGGWALENGRALDRLAFVQDNS